MVKLAAIAMAGAAGTLCRYGMTHGVRSLGAPALWGTIAVNLFGSFLFGFIYAWSDGRDGLSPALRPIILTGFMGAFTTFSTFIHDTHSHLEQEQWAWAGVNLISQTGIGLLALFCGILLGQACSR
ncbi:MAG: fluoride efflux transporter FluC [Planctomycetota bacterium]|jgi:CrcB protein